MKKVERVEFRRQFGDRPRIFARHDPDEIVRVKQEFKEECDINFIVARYKKTGVLPDDARLAAARYGDFSQIPDYQEMHEKLNAARQLFAALPARVRTEFNNDPGAFIDAASTPEGRELMVKLGLGKEVEPKPPGEPSKAVSGGQPQGGGTEPPPPGAKPGKFSAGSKQDPGESRE